MLMNLSTLTRSYRYFRGGWLLLTVLMVLGASASSIGQQAFQPKRGLAIAPVKLSEGERDYLDAVAPIKVCVDPNWLPHEKITDDGQHIGIFADLLSIVSDALRTPFELYPTDSWMETLEAAKSGRCDIISGLNRTQERDRFLRFTAPLISAPMVIVGSEEKPYLDNLIYLNGKTIASVHGYWIANSLAQDYPELKISHKPSVEDALRAVDDGEVYAAVGSLLGMSYQIAALSLSDFKVLSHTDYDGVYRVGVGLHRTQIVPLLNRAIRAIPKETTNNIVSHWVPLLDNRPADYTLVIRAIAVASLVIGLVLFRHREVSRHNQELADSNGKLQQAYDEQDTLIRTLAHEYRTPLSIIQSGIGLLKHDFNANEGKPNKERLKMMERASQRLSQIVDQCLKEESNLAGHEDNVVLLGDVIDEIIQQFEDAYPDHDLSISGNVDIPIAMSRHDLLQCLDNLLTNAAKYSDPDCGPISVVCFIQDGMCSIQVVDRGIGIMSKDRRRIFQRYYRGVNVGNRPGTGLGLYLSRQLAEKVGGKLVLHEIAEGGSCFELSVPLAQNR